MKRCIFMMLCILSLSICKAQSNTEGDYYWYKNQKIFLERGDERYVLFNAGTKSGIDTSAYVRIEKASDNSMLWGIQKNNVPLTGDVKYVAPSYFIARDSSNMYLTEHFYVKLKQQEDYNLLVNYAAEQGVEIIEGGEFRSWYILACTELSKGNALEMANLFYESSLFAAAEPEFINIFRLNCAYDPYFSQQWNLNNNSGIDINYCAAHAITTGLNTIRIAVIDNGIASHLDVSYSLSYSYDAHTLSTTPQLYDNGVHGTSCAGIIGAHVDNNHGIAGIAPDCTLASISCNPGATSAYNMGKGITYAANHGISILNNSWDDISRSGYIEDAIDYALTEGRDGKGCVVVFPSGNENTNHLYYPANCNEDIIVVGAMTRNASRANYTGWGSNYGQGLDIMAPGDSIPTTIPSQFPNQYIGSFTTDFSGTSAACSHVSAVAGLVLSINPDLTQKEVAIIIESTAQKVGNYTYDSIAQHGSWNNEVGYGLVDAYAAVLMAYDRYVQNTVYDIFPEVISAPNEIFVGRNVTNLIPEGDVYLPYFSEVSYLAGTAIHLKPGFHASLGSKFSARIGSVTTSPNAIIERESDLKKDARNTINEEPIMEERKDIPSTPLTMKFLRDGQLLIIQDGTLYNAQGIKVK